MSSTTSAISGPFRDSANSTTRSGAVLLRGVVGSAQPGQEFVALVCPVGILGHDALEEFRYFGLLRIARIPDVLPVIVPALERVVLHGNEVVGDVVEPGLAC